MIQDQKNFQLKHEIILAEMSSIDENIKKIEAKKRIETDIAHKREWENIKSDLVAYPDKHFRSFFRQFGQSCLKLKRPMLTIGEIYQEIDLEDDILLKILQHIKSESYRGVCGISMSFDGGLFTRFAKELSKI